MVWFSLGLALPNRLLIVNYEQCEKNSFTISKLQRNLFFEGKKLECFVKL